MSRIITFKQIELCRLSFGLVKKTKLCGFLFGDIFHTFFFGVCGLGHMLDLQYEMHVKTYRAKTFIMILLYVQYLLRVPKLTLRVWVREKDF